jgi:uncharacterized protein (DUF2267 family)
MNEDTLLSRVHDLAGVSTANDAERAVAAVLGALGSAAAEGRAQAIARDWPRPVARWLTASATHAVSDASALYQEVGSREGVEPEVAVEHCQAVLHALAEEMEPERLAQLHQSLPADIAALVRPRSELGEASLAADEDDALADEDEPTLANEDDETRIATSDDGAPFVAEDDEALRGAQDLVPESAGDRSAARRTLSSARPGPSEPIAEAPRPLAHRDSVARSAAPHAKRQVGTGHPTHAAGEGATLANARPGKTPK